MPVNKYYFEIKDANILECYKAETFDEAKHLAFKDWGPMWQRIEWLDPQPTAQVSPNNV
jgi:hypothetical protein